MGDFWNYGWLLNYEWLLNYGWVGGQAHRHTDRHTHRHINTMTRPGQRAGPSEKFTHNSKVHRQFKSSPIIQKFMCKAKLWVRGQARRHRDKHTHTHTQTDKSIPGHVKDPAYGQQLALLYVCDSGVPILYHEFKSKPLVLSIPWVHVYTMIPCLCHEFMSIPWVLSNNEIHFPYNESRKTIIKSAEIQTTGIQKYILQEN